MPRRNRVTPLGELIADPARGLVYGNRGCLHDANGRIRRHHQGTRWIACRLEFKGRRRPLMRPGRYTELFFLDEATAFAAGHRPCAECRRADYLRTLELTGMPSAGELDARLHAERLGPKARADVARLPTGAFVLHRGAPHVVVGASLHPWAPSGYGAPVHADGNATLITPPTLVHVLASDWRGDVPLLHPSLERWTS
jgi:hypothetical protein